ncbi:hypothetical protein ACTHAM_002271 [Cellulomonas soli]|uniref:hypothetical protein n=1 Tax=Cellulomonas soli TaxID=931535 RepID=UPI003F86DE56
MVMTPRCHPLRGHAASQDRVAARYRYAVVAASRVVIEVPPPGSSQQVDAGRFPR